jgi:cytochrome oxidase Cu insertion factor (SCO1/SenC/PrrC family)
MQNSMVAMLQVDYRNAGVHFVSITCDPATDTPARLAKYGQAFGADPQRWHFLTGDFGYIQRIGLMFETVVKKETHSDRLFVVDRQGKNQGGFRSTLPEQFAELKNLVDQLLSLPVEEPVGDPADAPGTGTVGVGSPRHAPS